ILILSKINHQSEKKKQPPEMRNRTSVTEFILLGLTDNPELQAVIFFLLLTYVLSVTGKLTIIVLTLLHSYLKTPMYFFLRNFSFLEISFTSVCNPRFLISILTGDKSISYNACAAQLFFFILLGSTDNKICYQLVGSSWLAGFLVIFPPLTMGLQLDFCDTNVIDHFTCDSAPLLQISCTDTSTLELMSFVLALLTLMSTLTLVILSYSYILRTILRIPSAQQRKKAFFFNFLRPLTPPPSCHSPKTCSSHMIVVSISYGSCIFMYVKTSATEGVALTKGVAMLHTSVAPLLNPFIYTLKNQQVKQAFKDAMRKIISSKTLI
uniref:G-protein coupled receptors family 1 profile domain-containing protein n=1 Tax=Catagonus wagneri TaxID=51154 RepID=A0A8C3WBB5_9CETA